MSLTIEREVGCDRSIVRKIKEISILHNWLETNTPIPSDEEIFKIWSPKAKLQKLHPLDSYREDLEQWRKEDKSAVVIYQLLKEKCDCDVQAIRRYLNKHFPKQVKPVMARATSPGQDMDIDFGYLGKFYNKERVLKKAWVFSFRLRHSRKTFRKVVLDQATNTFLMAHVEAFEWFGGVPKNVILDNCKAAVIQPTIDNDMIRRSYQELAEHYGFIISPCRPYTPEHKGGVEGDMKYVKTNFLPFFQEKQKEKNIEMSTLEDLSEALKRWGNDIADTHIVHGVGRSPLQIFKEEEQKELHTLPINRWELTSWSQSTVRRDWRILHDSAYYAVPYQFIGKTVQVCATNSLVRIFYDHKEIAFHEKAKEKWEYKRKAEYAPPHQEEVLQCTKEGLLLLSEHIGPFTYQVAYTILSHPAVDKLRSIRQLLNLEKKYSKNRLENACQRAFNYKLFSYSSVKNILENNLDLQSLGEVSTDKVIPMPQFRFARNPEVYKSSHNNLETFNGKLEKLHPNSRHGHGFLGAYEGLQADQIAEETK